MVCIASLDSALRTEPLKLEPCRFVVSVLPVEATDVRLGTYAVDVSELVLNSLAKINSSKAATSTGSTVRSASQARQPAASSYSRSRKDSQQEVF